MIRVAIDGVLHDEQTAKISVLDRGFLYGDSVYEVLRTYSGQLFGLEEHLDRLERSAALLGIPLPISRPALCAELNQALQAAGHEESYLRVIITRGAGPIGLDPALADRPCRVVIVTRLQPLPAALYARGVAIRLVAAGRAAEGAVPLGAKSGNYLVNIMALGEARRQGAHEAVLLDAAGRVTEGASSNIFALLDGVLHTPPLSAGILEGITRRKVITLARREGLQVVEQELQPAELQRAQEVFITSTLREILPVTLIDEQKVGDGQPGPTTRALHAAFQALARRLS